MKRHLASSCAWLLVVLTAFTGCTPTQPFYLHEDGDLSHYLDQATRMETPDVDTAGLPDAHQATAPLTVKNSEFAERWNLHLEEAVNIALQNSKVLRNVGGAVQINPEQAANQFLARPELSGTALDPAIQETEVRGGVEGVGVEAALSEFDAQFSTDVFWNRIDRPQDTTTGILGSSNPAELNQDLGTFELGIAKKSANGGVFSARNNTTYDLNNRPASVQTFPSDWFTAFELEWKQPLLRGAGTQVNRIPVILARIRTDVSLADFEANVRNVIMDVENAYWDLSAAYRALDAAKLGRDSAHNTWKVLLTRSGTDVEYSRVAQAREQYFFFRGRVEDSLSTIFSIESRLRFLMGIAPSDGRLICPIDEPTTANVQFCWAEILCEAQSRTAELRRQKWQIERREMELIAAKNRLLPQLDLTTLYRWQGLGDDLIASEGRADNGSGDPKFLQDGSTAFDTLLSGDYQDFRVGLELRFPVGFRAELSGVRNAQLNIAREKARLEDMELAASHLLSESIRSLDREYQLMQTNFNRWIAAKQQVELIIATWEKSEDISRNVDLLLDAQRRMSDAQAAYYQSLSNYNKSIAFVHFRKGSLLEYDNVCLAEGPWPAKAYWDALNRARQRDASQYLDYGWSRPRVISQGEVLQHVGDANTGAVETVEDEMLPGEAVPTPAPTPAAPKVDQSTSTSGRQPVAQRAAQPMGPELAAPIRSTARAAAPTNTASNANYGWGDLGLQENASRAQPAAYQTPRNSSRHEPVTNPPARSAARYPAGW